MGKQSYDITNAFVRLEGPYCGDLETIAYFGPRWRSSLLVKIPAKQFIVLEAETRLRAHARETRCLDVFGFQPEDNHTYELRHFSSMDDGKLTTPVTCHTEILDKTTGTPAPITKYAPLDPWREPRPACAHSAKPAPSEP
jgi:hypothetical protein